MPPASSSKLATSGASPPSADHVKAPAPVSQSATVKSTVHSNGGSASTSAVVMAEHPLASVTAKPNMPGPKPSTVASWPTSPSESVHSNAYSGTPPTTSAVKLPSFPSHPTGTDTTVTSSSSGSAKEKAESAMHPLPSVAVTVYAPPPRPDTVGPMTGATSPDHTTVYPGVPPVTVASAAPSVSPKQVGSVADNSRLNSFGASSSKRVSAWHPARSTTPKPYRPAVRPEATNPLATTSMVTASAQAPR